MKKALKRLNGKPTRSVTEKRAVSEDDGEIVSQRINLRNKDDTGNSRVVANKNTGKCYIKLHRKCMRRGDDSNQSERCRQEADNQTNEKSFATGEQNIETNIMSIKDKRKGTQLVSVNKQNKIGGRITKFKVLLTRVDTGTNESINKGKIVPSILEPFLKSPGGITTVAKQDKTVEFRNRLSLSRKKTENKNKTLQSGSSLEQSSSDNTEDSMNKDAESIVSCELENEETSTNSNIRNDNDTIEENNQQQQFAVPETSLEQADSDNMEDSKNNEAESIVSPKLHNEETSTDSNKRNDNDTVDKENQQRPLTVPKTPRCLIKMRRVQLPRASGTSTISNIRNDNDTIEEKTQQQQFEVPKISLEQASSDNTEESIVSSKLHNEETSTYSNKRSDNDTVDKENEQRPFTVPKTPRCLIKMRRVQLPRAFGNKENAPTGRRGRKKLVASPKHSAKPEATPPITEHPQVSREGCKSPDIFSDTDPERESDIYAFHTQSSQSEHEDIAADIIEKMKKEGKIKLVKPKNQHDRKNNTVRPAYWLNARKNVTVSETTTKRKVGRPGKKEELKEQNKTTSAINETSKRNVGRPRKKEPNKTTSAIDETTKRKVGRRNKKVELIEKKQKTTVIDVDDYDHDDHFDAALNTNEEHEAESRVQVVKPMNRKSDGFSTLAQKVLREQTAIMSPGKPPVPTQNNNFDKLKLLQIANHIVRSSNVTHSTPNKPSAGSVPKSVRSNTATPSNRATPSGEASPSAGASPSARASASGGASPWRVDSENIPRLFYFSRTSDNLPSYSSDVIPSSQPTNNTAARSKDASKNSTAVSPSRILSDSFNISAIQDISPIKSHNNSSLNISNIENISPVKPFAEKFKENSVILNPNPRRGLAERSPLKPINILNVVSLPNRINVNQTTDSKKPSRGDKENVADKPNRIQNLNKSTNETLKSNTLQDASIASDFFGFSETENIDEDEELQPLPKSKLPSKKRLHHKLTKLKRLLPPKPTRVSYGTIRSIFNSPKKQQDIREMLSSTRAKAGTDANVTEPSILLDDESSNDGMSSIAHNEENSTIADEDLHLFDDLDQPQPQLSFNSSMKIRTYERPKRKAKRIRSFILFHSDSENEDEYPPAKPKRTKSNKNAKELTKFVSEFNSMCDEVDQYELVVEKNHSGR